MVHVPKDSIWSQKHVSSVSPAPTLQRGTLHLAKHVQQEPFLRKKVLLLVPTAPQVCLNQNSETIAPGE